jgi:hypothetical protein
MRMESRRRHHNAEKSGNVDRAFIRVMYVHGAHLFPAQRFIFPDRFFHTQDAVRGNVRAIRLTISRNRRTTTPVSLRRVANSSGARGCTVPSSFW